MWNLIEFSSVAFRDKYAIIKATFIPHIQAVCLLSWEVEVRKLTSKSAICKKSCYNNEMFGLRSWWILVFGNNWYGMPNQFTLAIKIQESIRPSSGDKITRPFPRGSTGSHSVYFKLLSVQAIINGIGSLQWKLWGTLKGSSVHRGFFYSVFDNLIEARWLTAT